MVVNLLFFTFTFYWTAAQRTTDTDTDTVQLVIRHYKLTFGLSLTELRSVTATKHKIWELMSYELACTAGFVSVRANIDMFPIKLGAFVSWLTLRWRVYSPFSIPSNVEIAGTVTNRWPRYIWWCVCAKFCSSSLDNWCPKFGCFKGVMKRVGLAQQKIISSRRFSTP